MKKSVLMVALCAVLCGSASAVEAPHDGDPGVYPRSVR